MLNYRNFLKILLCLGISQVALVTQASSIPPANKCQLDQKCQIPVDSNGFMGLAEFILPTPYVGSYKCMFSSSNTSIINSIQVSAINYTDGKAPNLAAIVPDNWVVLSNQTPQSFNVNWNSPNQPHPNITGVSLITNALLKIDPSTQLYITCSKE